MTQPIHYTDLDLLMRICDRMGYGVHYGQFIAEVSKEERHRLLMQERRKQDKKDAERRAKLEERGRMRASAPTESKT